jgi:hypothetical protein
MRRRDDFIDRVSQRARPTPNQFSRETPRPRQHLSRRTRLVEGRHRRWLRVIDYLIDGALEDRTTQSAAGT